MAPEPTKRAPVAKGQPQPSLRDIQKEQLDRLSQARGNGADSEISLPSTDGGWQAPAAGGKKGGKKALSLQEIQAEEQRAKAAREAEMAKRAAEQNQASASAAGPWSQAAPAKSLAEIQAEELRQQNAERERHEAARQANQSLQLGSAWGSKPAVAAVPQPSRMPPASLQASAGASAAADDDDSDDDMFWESSSRVAGGTPKTPVQRRLAADEAPASPAPATPKTRLATEVKGTPVPASPAKNSASPSLFGGSPLSKPFEAWCRQEMVQLAQSDDLTLIFFLLSLTSDEEVREYVIQYLGNTAAVRRFSEEFIRRKALDATDDWRTVTSGASARNAQVDPTSALAAQVLHEQQAAAGGGGKKKKKKKKGGEKVDPSMLGFSTPAIDRQDE